MYLLNSHIHTIVSKRAYLLNSHTHALLKRAYLLNMHTHMSSTLQEHLVISSIATYMKTPPAKSVCFRVLYSLAGGIFTLVVRHAKPLFGGLADYGSELVT